MAVRSGTFRWASGAGRSARRVATSCASSAMCTLGASPGSASGPKPQAAKNGCTLSSASKPMSPMPPVRSVLTRLATSFLPTP